MMFAYQNLRMLFDPAVEGNPYREKRGRAEDVRLTLPAVRVSISPLRSRRLFSH